MTLPLEVAPTVAADITALNARAVTDMLNRHLQPEGRPPVGVFAPEIQSPDGRRQADLIWMPTTIAGGRGELIGYEIKCSRSDLLRELADPGKADPWAQYCTRWWLVVSRPDLVDGLTIPDAWGILAPPSGRRTRSMTVLRQAPRLEPIDPSPGIRRVAAWQMYATHERIARLERDLAAKDSVIAQERRRVQELQDGSVGWISPQTKRIGRILNLAKQREQDESIWFSDLTDEDVATAIVDLAATRSAAQELRMELGRIANAVEQLTDPMRHTHDALARAARLASRSGKGPQGIEALLAGFPASEVMAS